MATDTREAHQPIHLSIRSSLDSEYATFHDEHIQYVLPSEATPWDPKSRDRPSPMALGDQKHVEVGAVFDKDIGNFQVRVFTPEGATPEGGWPALIWLHGGGWVMGGLGSENGFLKHVCKYVNCVVISVNYRHAPEHVYPAAANDVLEAFQWIVEDNNSETLCINTSKLAIGGLSAGGCLTAILSLKISKLAILPKPVFQVMICPVIDNTATTDTIWYGSQHAPWLTPSRMTWYREKYFSLPSEAANWDASPCFAPPDLQAKSPKTFIGVSECDLLAPEALRYAEVLEQAGVDTTVKVYKGATHSILVLAGIHQIGKKLVHDVCGALSQALGTLYDASEAPILPLTS
ncbi:hypothetical protein JX266_003565 [Neoarthrinium moseri]|nr:hypothetical protein JX266_003565 [Neoarthrinium moseri]